MAAQGFVIEGEERGYTRYHAEYLPKVDVLLASVGDSEVVLSYRPLEIRVEEAVPGLAIKVDNIDVRALANALLDGAARTKTDLRSALDIDDSTFDALVSLAGRTQVPG